MQRYVLAHEFDDPKSLTLREQKILGIPAFNIAQQIEGRRKSKEKLPTWYNTPNVVYPPGVNLEQSSSEVTSKYKTTVLIEHCTSRDLLIDLTGGFGIDSSAFSEKFQRVIHVEPNETLSAIAKYNHELFGQHNIDHIVATAEKFISTSVFRPNAFYIDPSRRNENNRKVFLLKDTVPDIISLLPLLLDEAEFVLVKVSPLLDLSLAHQELKHVRSIHVVAVHNECKEVLLLCQRNYRDEANIQTINFSRETETFKFTRSEEQVASINLSDAKKFLYEPNAAILKAGAFKYVAQMFQLSKLHQNTHFYTSEDFIPDFPGRVFEIEGSMKSDPKEARKFFPQGNANVITRNYPLKAEELKQKLKLSDGGHAYLIGATSISKKVLLAARRIK